VSVRNPCFAAAAVVFAAVAIACASFGAAGGDGAATPDGGAPGDGGGDVSSVVSCPTPVVFVDDFSAPALSAKWTPMEKTATVGISSAPGGLAPVSPPGALFASGTLPNVSANMYAYVEQDLGFVPSSLSVSYAVAAPQTTAYALIGCSLAFYSNTEGVSLDLIVYQTNLATRRSTADGGYIDYTLQGNTSLSNWTKIALEITIANQTVTGAVARTALDGTPIQSAKLDAFSYPAGTKTVLLDCGLMYADMSDQANGNLSAGAALDDLVVRACP
jgi:hypothetical protein